MGCWTAVEKLNSYNGWSAQTINSDGSHFAIYLAGEKLGELQWSLLGKHNIDNALAAIAATNCAGIDPSQAIAALSKFSSVKRRLEIKGSVNNITVYDDFAHHPTAIASTLAGLRAKVGNARIFAVLELASYTMRQGNHGDKIIDALQAANHFTIKNTENTTPKIIDWLKIEAKPGDHILVMSNRGFDNIHEKILNRLS